jgi:hypothetical protein
VYKLMSVAKPIALTLKFQNMINFQCNCSQNFISERVYYGFLTAIIIHALYNKINYIRQHYFFINT